MKVLLSLLLLCTALLVEGKEQFLIPISAGNSATEIKQVLVKNYELLTHINSVLENTEEKSAILNGHIVCLFKQLAAAKGDDLFRLFALPEYQFTAAFRQQLITKHLEGMEKLYTYDRFAGQHFVGLAKLDQPVPEQE